MDHRHTAARRMGCGLLLLAMLGLAACQPAIRLMPSPLSFTRDDAPWTPDEAQARNAPEIPIFYATNRQVLVEDSLPVHTIFPGAELRLGVAHLRVGDGQLGWEDVERLSRSPVESNRPPIRLKEMEQQVVLSDQRDLVSSLAARAWFGRINAALARSRDKDLIIYVHGANNALHRATAQAAQFQHFTGRQAVVVAFIWPSAERVRTYFTDIRQARASVPMFTRLVELLAANTDARHIDVLAYSAGAEIASAGLASLSMDEGATAADATAATSANTAAPAGATPPQDPAARAALRERLRLGQVYFAAPDVGTRAFTDDMGRYIDLAQRVTLSANMNDTSLRLAAIRHRNSRAGRADLGELSAEQTAFLLDASNKLGFDLVEVDPAVIPGMARRSHGFWYTNAWVSNDVVSTFLHRGPPDTRGLAAQQTTGGGRYWIFPEDYATRVAPLDIRTAAPAAPTTSR